MITFHSDGRTSAEAHSEIISLAVLALLSRSLTLLSCHPQTAGTRRLYALFGVTSNRLTLTATVFRVDSKI